MYRRQVVAVTGAKVWSGKGITDMAKSKIFIASSGRTLVLAEKLRDELRTDYCEAVLWKQVSAGKASETIIEMLEGAASHYDFGVVRLSRDDVILKGTGDEQKRARDNCIFEAGLFMSALGRKRCFLVNSVKQAELPSDLGGIIYIPFTEPADLTNRDACHSAIMDASGTIKDVVQASGSMTNRPLSLEALLEREKSIYEGGELGEDQVVVAAIQPAELGFEAARQVSNNIDGNIRYVYFFHGDSDGAEKICQVLQLVLVAPLLADAKEAADFKRRRELIASQKDQIVDKLTQICKKGSFKIYFLPAAPDFQYCIHNAVSHTRAQLYFKRRNEYLAWETGESAYRFWKEARSKFGVDDPQPPNAVVYGVLGFSVHEGNFFKTLKSEVETYFPGIQGDVIKLCLKGSD